jgi:mannan endo-1,4-beta-mannosidase
MFKSIRATTITLAATLLIPAGAVGGTDAALGSTPPGTSPATTSSPAMVRVGVDDTAAPSPASAWAFTGSWSRGQGADKYGGTDHFTDSKGAAASFSFAGEGVELYAALSPWHGRGVISLDGNYIREVDLYAPSRQDQHMLWSSSTLGSGRHTVTLTALGSRSPDSTGSVISVDYAVVISARSESAPSPPGDFVTRDGGALRLGGKPYTFSGTNMYEALSDGSSTRGCGADMMTGSTLATALTALGRPTTDGAGNVIRVWFFQRYSVNGTTRDWTYFDKAVAAAKATGYRLIPVLGNEWTDCEVTSAEPSSNWLYGQRRSPQWYQNGYKNTPDSGALTSYRDWVQEVVSRYKNDPTVAFWQMMNEAESANATNGTYGVKLLRDFADDVGRLVKSVDTNHLLSFGTIGTGQNGAPGENYSTIHASPYIDLAEVHDYSTASTQLAGDPYNGLAVRVSEAQALGKPIFVGEFGNQLDTQNAENPQARATLYRQKLRTYFTGGFSGALVWNFTANPAGSGSYDAGPNDPIWPAVRSHGL